MSSKGKKRPPKRHKFGPEDLATLEMLAGIRIPQYQMASFFKNAFGEKMNPEGFETHLRHDNAARNAMIEGRSKAATKIKNTLYQMAVGEETMDVRGRPTGKYLREPDMAAMRFWCETQEGFKREEKLQISAAVTTNMPTQVIIQIPDNGRAVDND